MQTSTVLRSGRVPTTITLSPEAREMVAEMAKQDLRHVSTEIEALIREEYVRRQASKPTTEVANEA